MTKTMMLNCSFKSTSYKALLFMIFCSSCAIRKPVLPDKEANIIETKTKEFLSTIPDAYLSNFGIEEQAQLKELELGEPVEIYTIKNGDLLKTNTSRIPAIIDGNYKALATLVKSDSGDFEIVDFGAHVLATEIEANNQREGFVGIVRVYELHQDFFIFAENQGKFIFQAIPGTKNQIFTFQEILDLMNNL